MTEKGIQTALRDVRRAMLDADVNVNVADALLEGVKKRAIGREVTKGVTADQQFVKVMYDELLDMMGGGESSEVDPQLAKLLQSGNQPPSSMLASGTSDNPAVVLLAGLQGAGKTTVAGKLALYLKEREVDYAKVAAMDAEEASTLVTSRMPTKQRKVLLVAADVYRPAAIKQLQVLGEAVGVDVFQMGAGEDPVTIAKEGVAKAKAEGYDTVLIDTAGRQVIDDNLMGELGRIKDAGE
jgi:signal recognition particle subunit SRP54